MDFGLARLGDLPHRHGGDAGSPPHRVRQRHLIAGFGVDRLPERYAAAGGADIVAAAPLELNAERDGILDVPAAVDPIGGRNPHTHGPVGRKGAPAHIENLEPQSHSVLAAAAVDVGAAVDQRRQELVDEIAMGKVQFDQIDADFARAPRRVAPCRLHALDPLDVHDRRWRMHIIAVIRRRDRCPSALLRRHRPADHERRQDGRLAAGMRELHAEFRGAELTIETNDMSERLLVRIRVEAQAHGRNAPGRLDRCSLGDREPKIGQRVGAEMNGVPLARMAILRGILAHRREHDPVVQRQSSQRDGREQPACGHSIGFRMGVDRASSLA